MDTADKGWITAADILYYGLYDVVMDEWIRIPFDYTIHDYDILNDIEKNCTGRLYFSIYDVIHVENETDAIWIRMKL